PDKCLSWVQASLSELRDSMIDDYNNNRLIGWLTRIRQVEEVYFRTLYILFLAAEEEAPHILAGDYPNSFGFVYNRVNEEILFGRGELTNPKAGLSLGEFKPMDILNAGAHVGFRAMQMVVLISQHSSRPPNIGGYLKHVGVYIDRIDHMRKLFEAGRDKETVRGAITNLHRPKEYWDEKQKEAQALPSKEQE
ncbi:MAG: hypothetical protein KGM96_09435, partial [Acidobacteriota bacterium]|nr:hypothetical protein [Acidobacteriota bacterium]